MFNCTLLSRLIYSAFTVGLCTIILVSPNAARSQSATATLGGAVVNKQSAINDDAGVTVTDTAKAAAALQTMTTDNARTKPGGGQTRTAQTGLLEMEVMRLRSDVLEAIRRRDTRTLERLYTDDFTHTHAVGKVDGKAQRIAALVSGEPTIESATPDELRVRVYAPATAIATGRSTLSSADDGAASYRWTIVYVKHGGIWRIAASHASRVVSK